LGRLRRASWSVSGGGEEEDEDEEEAEEEREMFVKGRGKLAPQ
jgi:hypothetical protein